METQVTTQRATVRSAGIRFGLIGAVISIAYFVILNVSGVDITRGFWSWFGYLITAVLIFFAHKYYKENGDGFMPYGQGIGVAFWLGLISGSISSIFSYLYIKFIDTAFIDMIKDKQIEAMQQQGLPDEQIDKALEISSMFMTAEAILIMGLIGGIIAAVIIGLIVTIFTQKKNPEPAF
ncbi:MAG: DUF4199 domain-containing protein [Cyclobacteriaceae bacterium]